MRGFNRYRQQLQAALLSAAEQCARSAAEQAKMLVPVGDGRDGGHLRDCIFSAVHAQEGYAAGCISADNPHALHVEMGTSRMPASPYLRPALKAQKERFLHLLTR